MSFLLSVLLQHWPSHHHQTSLRISHCSRTRIQDFLWLQMLFNDTIKAAKNGTVILLQKGWKTIGPELFSRTRFSIIFNRFLKWKPLVFSNRNMCNLCKQQIMAEREYRSEKSLIFKYSSTLHALLHALLHVLAFTHHYIYKNSNHVILYTHTNIHHDSIFALNCVVIHSIFIYAHAIHAKLKTSFHLP